MTTNKDAVRHLESRNIGNANYIVGQLVEGGFIEETPMTEPEKIAERAKQWLGNKKGSKETYRLASGWSTDSWAHVLERSIQKPEGVRDLFLATIILAKEAGEEL